MKQVLNNRYQVLKTLFKIEGSVGYLCEDRRLHNAKRIVQEMTCDRLDALNLCKSDDKALPMVTDFFSIGRKHYIVLECIEDSVSAKYQVIGWERIYTEFFRVLNLARRLQLEASERSLVLSPSGEVRMRYRLVGNSRAFESLSFPTKSVTRHRLSKMVTRLLASFSKLTKFRRLSWTPGI